MSLTLRKRFDDAPGELDCHVEVKIVDDLPVRVSMVHQVCILEVFSVRYLIDLVPIPLRETKVIVGMVWLRPNGAMIDCHHQLVRV